MITVVLVVDGQTEFFAEVTKMMPDVQNFHQAGWNVTYRIYQFDIEDCPALEAWKKMAENTRGYITYDTYDENGERYPKPGEEQE